MTHFMCVTQPSQKGTTVDTILAQIHDLPLKVMVSLLLCHTMPKLNVVWCQLCVLVGCGRSSQCVCGHVLAWF